MKTNREKNRSDEICHSRVSVLWKREMQRVRFRSALDFFVASQYWNRISKNMTDGEVEIYCSYLYTVMQCVTYVLVYSRCTHTSLTKIYTCYDRRSCAVNVWEQQSLAIKFRMIFKEWRGSRIATWFKKKR